MLSEVLSAYGLDESSCSVLPFGSGLINNTWKVEYAGKRYILQRINHNVFRDPAGISKNIEMMGDYLAQQSPDYLFVAPIRAVSGESILKRRDTFACSPLCIIPIQLMLLILPVSLMKPRFSLAASQNYYPVLMLNCCILPFLIFTIYPCDTISFSNQYLRRVKTGRNRQMN
jgi:hypothetical protein